MKTRKPPVDPSPQQLDVIRALAKGCSLDVYNARGSGILSWPGGNRRVSAADMTALLYHVEAIEQNPDTPPGQHYRLTQRGRDLAP